MNVITIPKAIAQRGDLMVVPRREYEALVSFQRERETLDDELDTGLAEYRAGKFAGPFSWKEVVSFLRMRRKRPHTD